MATNANETTADSRTTVTRAGRASAGFAWSPEEIVPGRSFLTPKQRRYLCAQPNSLNQAQQRQHRYQIRKSIQSTLADFNHLWNLSEKDLTLALKPLAAPNQVSTIAEEEIQRHPSLADIDMGEVDENLGWQMWCGLADLLAVYTRMYGTGASRRLVEEALNQAALRLALSAGRDMGAYKVEIERREKDITDLLPPNESNSE